jgi:hypothetical protein
MPRQFGRRPLTLITFDPTSCALIPPDPAVNRIIFDAAHGVDATDGAEQPVWDPGTQKFYLSIPEISGDGSTNLHGAVLRIAPTGVVEALYPVDFCAHDMGLRLASEDCRQVRARLESDFGSCAGYPVQPRQARGDDARLVAFGIMRTDNRSPGARRTPAGLPLYAPKLPL